MIRPLPRALPLTAILAATFLAGAGVGRLSTAPPTRSPLSSPPVASASGLPAPVNAARIREVWHVLHEKFAGPLDDADLAEGALRGIAASTGDPYTAYADPDESKLFESDLSGSFTGVGIEIGLRRGLVTVIAPLRGSPAEQAGIRARDIIVKIDGTEVDHELTLTEVVGKIRGPAGTTVHLTVAREGEDEPREFSIRRARIEIESATLLRRDRIAVITVSAFNDDTERRFRGIARQVLSPGASGILLDLRNNPGGVLEEAVRVAGHFLPEKSLVVTEVGRDGKTTTEHRTDGPADLVQLPLVVLINGGSASAAEILAAALHEQREVPLVGEQTFGKGSVQEYVRLQGGASLRVTIARWHTPKGTELSDDGLEPTVVTEDKQPTDDPDEILEKGLELLQQQRAGGRR